MERRHLPREDMIRAIGMLQAGRRQIEVAAEFHVTQSVISRLWRRYRATGEVRNQHRGNGRITTAVQDRYIQLSARRNHTCTARLLQNQFQQTYGVLISDQTIRNRLHEVHLRSRRPLRVPPLTRGNRGERLLWAQEHRNWTNEQWAHVLFSDESRFGLYSDSRRIRVWRQPGRVNRLNAFQEVHSFRGGTIMVWGGISIGGRTDLVLLQGNMTAQVYVNQIILPVVVPYAGAVGENFLLMQDNARPHVAQITINVLEQQQISLLEWPAQSPDMNPLEHLWDKLQRRVTNANEHMNNPRDVFRVLQREWRAIPQQEIDNLILTIHNRIRAVINNRGGHTDY